MEEHPEYMLEPLRERADFTLYRGRECGNQMPILAVEVAADQPSPQSLRRLEHEYSLATELDAAWAAQPLALTRHQGRAVLILKDPGGDPLDLVIEQHKGQLIDLACFLGIAIGLAAALNQAHRQGLIHKDVKPANVLVDDAGHVWLTGLGIASRLQCERQAPAPPEDNCRHSCLHVPGTNRAHEPLGGFTERSLLSRRDIVRNAYGRAPICRSRSSGMDPLPHRTSAYRAL